MGQCGLVKFQIEFGALFPHSSLWWVDIIIAVLNSDVSEEGGKIGTLMLIV